MPSVLEQLGINPDVGATMVTDTGAVGGKASMTEGVEPMQMKGLEELADTLIAGAILILEQAFAIYGSGTEKGKQIMKMLRTADKLVTPDKVNAVKQQATTFLGDLQGAGSQQPQSSQPQMPMPQAPQTAGGGAVSIEDIERLLKKK